MKMIENCKGLLGIHDVQNLVTMISESSFRRKLDFTRNIKI